MCTATNSLFKWYDLYRISPKYFMNLTEFQIKLVHVNWIVQMDALIAETLYASVTES